VPPAADTHPSAALLKALAELQQAQEDRDVERMIEALENANRPLRSLPPTKAWRDWNLRFFGREDPWDAHGSAGGATEGSVRRPGA